MQQAGRLGRVRSPQAQGPRRRAQALPLGIPWRAATTLGGMLRIHESFVAFAEAEVLPRLLQDPVPTRLDGSTERKGNRAVVGLFRHEGQVWRVNADSHLEPLLLAYYSAKFRTGAVTFVRAKTGAAGARLDLAPELDRLRPNRRGNARHLYLYRVST